MNEPIAAPVIATLCLPTVKAGATFRVFGKSRKPIEFRRSPKHQMLVREYTSAAEFHRDDRDLREALGSPYVITTLLGVGHPVIQAKEALANLIGATQQVDITTRKAALADIIESAQAAIDRMDGKAVEPPASVPDAPIDEAPSAPRIAVEMRPEAWTTSSRKSDPVHDTAGAPIMPLDPAVEPEASKRPARTVPRGGRHTNAELMDGTLTPMETLRTLAKDLGISLHQPTGGAKSRPMLVADVLAAEQQKAA